MKFPLIRTLLTLGVLNLSPWSPLHAESGSQEEENSPQIQADIPGKLEKTAEFVRTYCSDCHDEWSERGDRNFDDFLDDLYNHDHLLTVEEILDQLNLGEMPPKKKKVLQPSADEVRAAVASLTDYLIQSESNSKPQTTILRRLTTAEYKNTISDLLDVNTYTDDLTTEFPPEQDHHGFRNIGEAQVLSDIQLQRIVKANRHYVEKAFPFHKEKPKSELKVYKAKDFNARPYSTGGVNYQVAHEENKYLDIGHGSANERFSNYVKEHKYKGGIQKAGYYTITIDATAINRKHPYPTDIYHALDLEEPLQLALWIATAPDQLGESSITGRKHLALWDLKDHQRESYSITTWLPEGAIPSISWLNGASNTTGIFTRLYNKVLKDKIYPTDYVRILMHREAKDIPTLEESGLPPLSDLYEGPRVRVFQMQIEGPTYKEWPTALHQSIFAEAKTAEEVDIANAVLNFATKAFRQPVKPHQLKHYVAAIEKYIQKGMKPDAAIRLGFAGILSSPRFLYLNEGNSDKQKHLNSYEVANRLSYTFWSSAPDERLLNLAASGEILVPSVMSAEVTRLLQSPKSEAFHIGFTDTWLRLDKLGSMLPSESQFPRYFHNRLQQAMKSETQLFFADILNNNKPIRSFLDSRYTYVNGALANHYGWDHVHGSEFRKVEFPKNNPRPPGVVGHASVLTSSANGVETSPVTRGVWVLEALLGTPPAPAPPDVPPIEPDTRGATTIKERLAKHRTMAVCNDCHAKIDAWGFALENYDPVGVYRSNYPITKGDKFLRNKGPKVDPSGELPDGTVIHNVSDLTKELLKREKSVTRNIVVKFLSYSTGRDLNYADQQEVNRITTQVKKEKLGLRDLIGLCISSKVFSKR